MQAVSITTAIRTFARLLRDLARGKSTGITRLGKWIPVLRPQSDLEREQAVKRAIALMREGIDLGGRRFSRDEMHER
jgi:antitoxin (DNA-binding transcriptional repressor) of toxin-antitoxin stability system